MKSNICFHSDGKKPPRVKQSLVTINMDQLKKNK